MCKRKVNNLKAKANLEALIDILLLFVIFCGVMTTILCIPYL